MSKYPVCERMGLLKETNNGLIFNEDRFFSKLTYVQIREFEDRYTWSGKKNDKIKVNEAEDYLANYAFSNEE